MLRRIRDFRSQSYTRDETYENVVDLVYFIDRKECELRFIQDGKREDITFYDIESITSRGKMCVNSFVFAEGRTLGFTFKPKKTVEVHQNLMTIM